MTSKDIQRYQKKSVSALIKLATKHFNHYIRLRDSRDGSFTCISCGQTKSTDSMHAGHFLSAGHHAVVRFDERNVHGQCHHCNTFLHGNLLGYQEGLENKLGLIQLADLRLKSRMRGFKWDRFALIEIILTYSKKCKDEIKSQSLPLSH